MILGIETSCDETAAALVTRDGEILASIVASQDELHARYGGVVPEIASRRHLELVIPVVEDALGRAGATLDDVELVAATTHPGLIGALLVGVSAAKAIAWARRLPLAPVNHLHGHVASLYLKPLDLEPPFTCLLASGGHTMLLDVPERGAFRVLGTTLDDAAGEAFDKGARLLGLGYPGGRAIDALAAQGDPEPPMTSRSRACPASTSRSPASRRRSSIASATCRPPSSSSGAPTSPRATSTRSSARSSSGSRPPAATGSPSSAASPPTRSSAPPCPDAALAPLALCTDNAAMIASAARYMNPVPYPEYLSLDAQAAAG